MTRESHPELELFKALCIAWVKSQHSCLGAIIVHAAEGLESLCPCRVPDPQGDHPAVLACNLDKHAVTRAQCHAIVLPEKSYIEPGSFSLLP